MPPVPPEEPAASPGPRPSPGRFEDRQPLVRRTIVADALLSAAERERLGFPTDEREPIPVVIELNLRHHQGLSGARQRFEELYAGIPGERSSPQLVAETYYRCWLSVEQVKALVAADMADPDPTRTSIYRIWPDFPVSALIDMSCSTVKADAARRSYDAAGRNITWAVIDSGIDASHQHFATHDTLGGDVAGLHRDFTLPGDPELGAALRDGFGHGTHVAGIIAGGLPARMPRGSSTQVVERVVDPNQPNSQRLHNRKVDPAQLAGMAPRAKLISLKALNDNGGGNSMDVVRALEYVRKELNGSGKLPRVHGVNLSVGYEFDAKWFACGQSPICAEVDRLVRSGVVVVVVAAGNTGYGSLSSIQRQTDVGLTMTINDPGNAELAITVGATHRDMPHTYGVSYFSSKGPTGDGRSKPDLVAPGERITSCAAGKALASVNPDGPPPDPKKVAVYVEDSGTSMAAPHVSGAIAAFLSIRREFIGQPEQVKRIFLESATSLGRERYFQGHGLVDLMRAIQSV